MYPLTSAVYYSVQETETHYFINYCFFHPRDDAPVSLDRHENDFEGALFVIEKDGSEFGSFLLMETQAHNHFYQYSNDTNILDGSDDIDGGVIFDGLHHPCVYIYHPMDWGHLPAMASALMMAPVRREMMVSSIAMMKE